MSHRTSVSAAWEADTTGSAANLRKGGGCEIEKRRLHLFLYFLLEIEHHSNLKLKC